jgi:hypothetical protein
MRVADEGREPEGLGRGLISRNRTCGLEESATHQKFQKIGKQPGFSDKGKRDCAFPGCIQQTVSLRNRRVRDGSEI